MRASRGHGRRAMNGPLAPVIKGVSRSLADSLSRWSGTVSGQMAQIPSLTVRVRP
jgi:hypothetical protein